MARKQNTTASSGEIFVTVGTDNHDFSRLVKKMDEIAKSRNVVIQTGFSEYKPKNAKWFDFTDFTTLEKHYEKAKIIVTHAGAGSIINSLRHGKIPIVVPRLKEYNEHEDDHQLETARGLSKTKSLRAVLDVSELDSEIAKGEFEFRRKRNTRLASEIEKFLDSI